MKKIIFLFLATVALAGCSGGDGDGGVDVESITLTSQNPTDLTAFTATVVTNANHNVSGLNYGMVYGTLANPALNDGVSQEIYDGLGDDNESFTTYFQYLTPGQTYYLRAYVYDGNNIKYGNQVTLITPQIVTTGIARDITARNFTIDINVLNSGLTIDGRGVVYGSSHNPTHDNLVLPSGTGGTGEETLTTGFFDALTINTVYYVRSYVYVNGQYFYGNEVSFRSAGYLGGSGSYVFYDKGETTNGWRYLEVAPNSVGTASTLVWGCSGFISGLQNGIGTGNDNSNLIAASCANANGAAKLCVNLNLNGQTDWFLPSIDEVTALYDLKLAGIMTVSSVLWSSSQFSTTNAFVMSFDSGVIYDATKTATYAGVAWPVRRF